mgnify:CR=1 FL=1
MVCIATGAQWSGTQLPKTLQTTIKAMPSSPKIRIYPLPFSDTLHISAIAPVQKVTVLNAIGQTLATGAFESKKVEMNLQELKPGAYFIRIETEKGIHTEKIVKK